MKTLRYVLIASLLMLLPMVAAVAQIARPTDMPRYEFQSTSSLRASGSVIPLSASGGVALSGETPIDYADGAASGPRRAKQDDDPWGGGTIGDISKPEEPGSPVGDGLWFLLILAAGYAPLHRRIASYPHGHPKKR